MKNSIAIVGIACVYPDARNPHELWENVLAQRQSFRRIPPERLRAEDYLDIRREMPDSIYSAQAAVIEGYTFDRQAFRISRDTFQSADMAHWLALDVASRAWADAGFADGNGLPHDATGVWIGNTLTGDSSRANLMRLRWPYVSRVLRASLQEQGWSESQIQKVLVEMEAKYKAPFPAVGEESLAGSLSNTIAGRICNHFDLHGGGYTVDGACASSLLAVSNACSALVAGDLDIALAGGVDLSLDPLEWVGFAKAGALAADRMRVYDARSEGFWPGEGCGLAVLMRHEDAVASGRRIYALIQGWGVSSDGQGGITRPQAEGQMLAIRRAYRRAGYGIDTVDYIEGHGTGTRVGDTTELEALSRAYEEASSRSKPACIGSVKANVGHTKAAAGIAGLLKATLALQHQILPPATGCETPHPRLATPNPSMRVLREPEEWNGHQPQRASVSAMGFGGINAHLTLESVQGMQRSRISRRMRKLAASHQDAELFLWGADNVPQLRAQLERLSPRAAAMSYGELADVAAELARALPGDSKIRAAILASSPSEFADRLGSLKASLESDHLPSSSPRAGIFVSDRSTPPCVGFLFPGQGSPTHLDGGSWKHRFPEIRDLYNAVPSDTVSDSTPTEIAQPAVVTGSLAGLAVLERLGIEAQIGIGHSLGELTALHWAGAFSEEGLLRIVHSRAEAMTQFAQSGGAMAAIAASSATVEAMIDNQAIVISGYNAPQQTIVSGNADAVKNLVDRARQRGVQATLLPVSHAFHTSHMADAAPYFADSLNRECILAPRRRVISTTIGKELSPNYHLRPLLVQQLTSPVRFTEAFEASAREVDLWIEVGPGNVLSGLAETSAAVPVVSIDAGGPSLQPLLHAVAWAFTLGVRGNWSDLYSDRVTRPFSFDRIPHYFANPCEQAPIPSITALPAVIAPAPQAVEVVCGSENSVAARKGEVFAASALDCIREIVVARTELPSSAVRPECRFLGDLHLNSISVGQIMTEAARRLHLPPLIGLTDFATSTIQSAADALEELCQHRLPSVPQTPTLLLPGVDTWVRPFQIQWVLSTSRPALSNPTAVVTTEGEWSLKAPTGWNLRGELQTALKHLPGDGVVVYWPPDGDARHLPMLLSAAQTVLASKTPRKLILLQSRSSVAAFARTLHLESPHIQVRVITVPIDHPQTAAWVCAETNTSLGFSEVRYDEKGNRWEPRWQALQLSETAASLPLSADDILLISGGGKGIAAECALHLAKKSQSKLVLLGRSHPDTDSELRSNLQRFQDAGIFVRYLAADVTDKDRVQSVLTQVQTELGPITAFLHASGHNEPKLISALDESDFVQTLEPKIRGAQNILAALQPAALRLFVAFGSILSRTGLPGEAHYGVANEWLAQLVSDYQAAHPHCRCVTAEWSVWSSVGMGSRVGRVETLRQLGVVPISPEAGASLLEEILRHPEIPTSVVLTSRFGSSSTWQLRKPELPFLRFLEKICVHYPGIELIVENSISPATDPYLEDHVVQGERLFPGVMALESMVQVAMALAQRSDRPTLEDIRFDRPIVIPRNGSATLRIAGLVKNQNKVEVVLRCSTSDFQTEHFRAVCRFQAPETVGLRTSEAIPIAEIAKDAAQLDLNPQRDLYSKLLFQSGRFQRVEQYRRLTAFECVAKLRADSLSQWFVSYLPQSLTLGDAGARDAAIHSIQACIPHSRLVPVGVHQIEFFEPSASASASKDTGTNPTAPHRWIRARQTRRVGDEFTFDLEICDSEGGLMERWQGLRLRKLESLPTPSAWHEDLLGPYVARRIEELAPGHSVSASLTRGLDTDASIHRTLGREVAIRRRSDGKPEATDGTPLSAAHSGKLTWVVTGQSSVACDLESITTRSRIEWAQLLGDDGFGLALTLSAQEGLDVAATRVWTAMECLKKAGAMTGTPLQFKSRHEDGWIVFSAAHRLIASCVVAVRGTQPTQAVAVLSENTPEPWVVTSLGREEGGRR